MADEQTKPLPILVMTDEQRQDSASAWQSYNAMETTKQRHFDFLNVLELKKKNFNLDPTENDTVVLEHLLKDHDQQVKHFTAESMALKEKNPETHKALFVYIGKINELLDSHREVH